MGLCSRMIGRTAFSQALILWGVFNTSKKVDFVATIYPDAVPWIWILDCVIL